MKYKDMYIDLSTTGTAASIISTDVSGNIITNCGFDMWTEAFSQVDTELGRAQQAIHQHLSTIENLNNILDHKQSHIKSLQKMVREETGGYKQVVKDCFAYMDAGAIKRIIALHPDLIKELE